MIPSDHDKPVQDLIAKVLLPPEECPSNPADIEAMLDAVGGEPFDEEMVDRLMKKAMGKLPIGQREEEADEWTEEALSEHEQELLALHRNEGSELPPDIQEKLRLLREQALAEEDDIDDDVEA